MFSYHCGQHKPVVESMLVDFEDANVETSHEGEDGNGHDSDLDDKQSRPTMLGVIVVWPRPLGHHLERRVAHDDAAVPGVTV